MSRKRGNERARKGNAPEPQPDRPVTRRAFLGAAAGGAALLVIGGRVWRPAPDRALAEVTVYKSPTCQCCGKWIDHMHANGFTTSVRELSDVTAVKRDRGVPDRLYSCHTTVSGQYVFEGHVPADLVARVLREQPAIRGLAVPGMPQSAPGMDIGRESYEVISFTPSGETAVFAVRS